MKDYMKYPQKKVSKKPKKPQPSRAASGASGSPCCSVSGSATAPPTFPRAPRCPSHPPRAPRCDAPTLCRRSGCWPNHSPGPCPSWENHGKLGEKYGKTMENMGKLGETMENHENHEVFFSRTGWLGLGRQNDFEHVVKGSLISKEIRMGLFSSLSDSGMGITVITVTWESMNRPTEAKWLGKCGVLTPAILLRLTVRILGLEPTIPRQKTETTWGEGNHPWNWTVGKCWKSSLTHIDTIQIDVVKIGKAQPAAPRAWPSDCLIWRMTIIPAERFAFANSSHTFGFQVLWTQTCQKYPKVMITSQASLFHSEVAHSPRIQSP